MGILTVLLLNGRETNAKLLVLLYNAMLVRKVTILNQHNFEYVVRRDLFIKTIPFLLLLLLSR